MARFLYALMLFLLIAFVSGQDPVPDPSSSSEPATSGVPDPSGEPEQQGTPSAEPGANGGSPEPEAEGTAPPMMATTMPSGAVRTGAAVQSALVVLLSTAWVLLV